MGSPRPVVPGVNLWCPNVKFLLGVYHILSSPSDMYTDDRGLVRDGDGSGRSIRSFVCPVGPCRQDGEDGTYVTGAGGR